MAATNLAEVATQAPVSCVGRQAILDAAGKLVAYELLYRDNAAAAGAEFVDDRTATATVMLNTVAELGMDAVVADSDMFINCSADVLAMELEALLPPERVVLEVLETVEVDAALAERLVALREAGFRIAFDDYVTSDGRHQHTEYADIIKVDVMAVGDGLAALMETLKHFDGLLLAEKVEDAEGFEECRRLGFHLFQGYYFCKPNVLARRSSPTNKVAVMRILAEVQRPDITIDEAVALVQQDVGVSYRLLRALNSVLFGMRHPVESVRQALVLLGIPRVRAWLSVMGLSSVKGKPNELLRVALTRAFMCQELSRSCKVADPDTLFTVGLLSVLDAVLDMEMTEVLQELPLSQALEDALLDQPCPEGVVLAAVLAYERGRFGDAAVESGGLDLPSLSAAWLSAVGRADTTAAALLGA